MNLKLQIEFLKNIFNLVKTNAICYRVLAACSVQILAFIHGMSLGWSSMNMFLNNLTPNDTDISWLGALYIAGVFIGVLCMDIFYEFIGQKRCLHILSVIPILHVLCATAENASFIYFAQLFTGISAASFLLIHKLVVEIIQPNLHKTFSITTLSITNFGLLLGNVLQTQKHYSIVAIVLSIIHLLIMSRFPESPTFSMKSGNTELAEHALKFYNYGKENMDVKTFYQLKDLEPNLEETPQDHPRDWKQFFNKISLKSYIITIVLMIPICQCFVLQNYMPYIIKTTDIAVDTQTCTILLGLSQIFGTFGVFGMSALFSHKTVYLIFNSAMTLSLITFGLFYQLNTETFLIKLNSVTLTLFMLTIFWGNNGIFQLIFYLTTEITPTKVNPRFSKIKISIMSLCLFVFVKLFPLSLIHLGLGNYFFLAFLISTISLIYLIIHLPTSDKKILSLNSA